MPPVLSRPTPVPFDPDWAQSLYALHLLVPSNWWPGYSSDDLNDAVVVDVDFAQLNQRFFKIVVDEHAYYMRYDAVFTYADSNQRGFQRFHLPRRFYGVMMARMQTGHNSVEDIWSTRSSLKAVAPIKESMPQDAFRDLCRCLHFANDWEEEDEQWDELYSDAKEEVKDGTASHRRKFRAIEDAYNKRWRECVHFGRCLTADESRIAGWFHSPSTIGPEPKPIRTGATLHTLCVTDGPLRTYKLFARTYGGKKDGDLKHINKNTATTQKWVNLYDIMLEPFKGAGRRVTMDSAYMGDIMAMVGREEWGMNMVGTMQDNRTGATTKPSKKRMKVGTYETVMFQHNDLPLVVALWADNNIVRTMSNFHSPKIIVDGLMRKKRVNGVRDKEQSPVSCPAQMQYYSETFHLIDKGNGAEAPYDIAIESHKHGWSPKLAFRLFNMTLNNAYKIYDALIAEYTPNRRYQDMGEAVELATHTFLQRGPSVRMQLPEHPSPVRDLTTIFDTGSGRKLRSDAQGDRGGRCRTRNESRVPKSIALLRKKQRRHPWCVHQSVAYHKRGRCSFAGCPNQKKVVEGRKRKRGYETYMRCVECSAKKGKDIYFCNTTKCGEPVLCHWRYHTRHFGTEEPKL